MTYRMNRQTLLKLKSKTVHSYIYHECETAYLSHVHGVRDSV